jgi:hypothetical protein
MSRSLPPVSMSFLLFLLVAGCGGGSGADANSQSAIQASPQDSGAKDPTPSGPATPTTPDKASSSVLDAASMKMACVDGPTYQCSGGDIIRIENGVGLTRSGVQAYGKSTIDAAVAASGFALGAMGSGTVAEVRVAKDSNGVISGPALLLSNLGISWDGRTERPGIVDTFYAVQEARVVLSANGAVAIGHLPDSSNLGFYDYATKGGAGTQLNYANNVYFPRSAGNPPRCPPGLTKDASQCATETIGVRNQAGDWRTGGSTPDMAYAVRFHADGDVHAGDAASGNPAILPGGSGIGVPYPGSKGYRTFDNWGYRYVNLGAWLTQDTVQIVEWTGGSGVNEHNQNRRGIVAFGDVTDSATVPTTGMATYSGTAYGWYTPAASIEPSSFTGAATATVSFATGEVLVALRDAGPVAFTASTRAGDAGSRFANYLTGAVGTGTLKGGLSGRYFGPSATGSVPPEIGGVFSLSDAESGRAAVGGFIARRQ